MPCRSSFLTAQPGAGAPAPFLVLAGRLCEANLFRGAHAAWFAGPRVLADGGLALVTPIEPLLLALPLLQAARRQARHSLDTGVQGLSAHSMLRCVTCAHTLPLLQAARRQASTTQKQGLSAHSTLSWVASAHTLSLLQAARRLAARPGCRP